MKTSRRNFLKTALVAGAALSVPSLIAPEEAQAKTVDKPVYELTKDYGRFDQKNTMFARKFWDAEYNAWRKTLQARDFSVKDEHEYMAMNLAAWHVHNNGAFMNAFGVSAQSPLMRWDDAVITMDEKVSEAYNTVTTKNTDNPMIWDDTIAPNAFQAEPEVFSRKVKNAGLFLGAFDVGVAKLDPNWIYSQYFNFKEKTSKPWPKDPAQFKYAVVAAIEMKNDPIRDLKTYSASASAGLGYSNMVEVADSLARFIRGLGYPAIPIGNDTMPTIPAALEAGMGELGRNGLLITPKFGPRVRLCAVLTDAPLMPDKPVDMGVKAFCDVCKKCAENCPNGCISSGEQTAETLNISNRPGVVRWPVDGRKCFDFWRINRSSCSVCIGVCPYNKVKGTAWFHDITPSVIEHASPLDRFLVFVDKTLGYGAKKPFEL
ncbi:reductive dehalogenase [Dehalobacter sp. TBBPA1]|jgi:reductive dehalogenase|uniref:reductive dehalogenase n=1 Tax=Dehalobacter sp. TBBPA1 TaxID=3235037 RepID=UPI0034A3DC17